jgi:hypothetical protein
MDITRISAEPYAERMLYAESATERLIYFLDSLFDLLRIGGSAATSYLRSVFANRGCACSKSLMRIASGVSRAQGLSCLAAR